MPATNAVVDCLPLSMPSITLQISIGQDLVRVPATAVAVNGQSFHMARVPFETRSAGSTNFAKKPNIFALTATPSVNTCSAWMGTNPCTFLNTAQATFTFSKADRGKAGAWTSPPPFPQPP